MSQFIVGLDLGQATDYTALAVIEKRYDPGPPKGIRLELRHLERPPLGTPYPEIVALVKERLSTPPLVGAHLVVDATGVGRPVVDLLRQAYLRPVAVTITAGDTVVELEGQQWRVPKRDLIASLQVAYQTGEIRVADRLPLASTLVKELLNFRVTINLKTAHDSYEAWREGQHDDLVLAVALATWWAPKARPPLPLSLLIGTGAKTGWFG